MFIFKNKPLKLDELKQLDGQPVWTNAPHENPCWGIVCSHGGYVQVLQGSYLFKHYGEWQAFKGRGIKYIPRTVITGRGDEPNENSKGVSKKDSSFTG
jgi:hypothetical protein